ncbi:hypothetical protein CV102_04150 [Natronococcus pandeyae]|uniref:Uncharacterized protein n=1 Tax=Natronococcus pandeyae TaxID=2055836 RepID=A0A8J8Q564_9EURY|nr:hypothetical protein CV102_04150 [Natronococcus pandeyae]
MRATGVLLAPGGELVTITTGSSSEDPKPQNDGSASTRPTNDDPWSTRPTLLTRAKTTRPGRRRRDGT